MGPNPKTGPGGPMIRPKKPRSIPWPREKIFKGFLNLKNFHSTPKTGAIPFNQFIAPKNLIIKYPPQTLFVPNHYTNHLKNPQGPPFSFKKTPVFGFF